MASEQGGGYWGRAGWGEARPMVRGSPFGVSGKRGARGRGFEAGEALTNGRAALVPAVGRQTGYSADGRVRPVTKNSSPPDPFGSENKALVSGRATRPADCMRLAEQSSG